MDESVPAPPSRGEAGRSPNRRYMSGRQTDAYLMARDLVRRIQQMSRSGMRDTIHRSGDRRGARGDPELNH